MKIHVIGSEDTVIGFGLIGIEGTIMTNPEDVKDLLLKLRSPRQYDLIIINTKLLQGLEDFIEKYRLNADNPILFDIPDETGVSMPESLRRFVKRAFTV